MSFKIKVGDFFRRNNRSNNEDELIAKKTRKNMFDVANVINYKNLIDILNYRKSNWNS